MSGKNRYFLDTNALVSLGCGEESLWSILGDADYIGTSVICKMEYLSWPKLSDNIRERFLMLLTRISLTGIDAADISLHEQVVAIRKSRPGIKLPDAIVMASAKAAGCILLTRDRQLLNAGLCETKAF